MSNISTLLVKSIAVILIAITLIVAIIVSSSKGTETKQEAVALEDVSIKHKACTAFMKKEGWFCKSGKEKTYYTYCEFKSVSGEKVTCQCFARIPVICTPELYFSLQEFNAEIKELKEEVEWEDD